MTLCESISFGPGPVVVRVVQHLVHASVELGIGLELVVVFLHDSLRSRCDGVLTEEVRRLKSAI